MVVKMAELTVEKTAAMWAVLKADLTADSLVGH